ncbi:hypothetical protein CHU98_g9258 [Xylaria longipes]|nr:hypothetical protein CHU98_g9258 [Xylaria longipes]
MAQPANPPFTTALLAGGIAGTTVDLSLFPLDTLKTRLQSHAGFFPSGGFRGVYRGIGSADRFQRHRSKLRDQPRPRRVILADALLGLVGAGVYTVKS